MKRFHKFLVSAGRHSRWNLKTHCSFHVHRTSSRSRTRAIHDAQAFATSQGKIDRLDGTIDRWIDLRWVRSGQGRGRRGRQEKCLHLVDQSGRGFGKLYSRISADFVKLNLYIEIIFLYIKLKDRNHYFFFVNTLEFHNHTNILFS